MIARYLPLLCSDYVTYQPQENVAVTTLEANERIKVAQEKHASKRHATFTLVIHKSWKRPLLLLFLGQQHC